MKIANLEVSYDLPPLIIAEIGINHGGHLATAKRMVYAAFSAGCRVIKHQTHFVEDEMTEAAKSILNSIEKTLLVKENRTKDLQGSSNTTQCAKAVLSNIN